MGSDGAFDGHTLARCIDEARAALDAHQTLERVRAVVGDGWFAGDVTHDVAVSRKLAVLNLEAENFREALSEALVMLEAGDDRASVVAMLKAELGDGEEQQALGEVSDG